MQKLFKNIEGFIFHDVKCNVFFGREKGTFRMIYHGIRANIEEIDQEKELTDVEVDKVFRTVKFLREKVMYDPLDDQTRCFIGNWVYLIFNWNSNTGKSDKLKSECQLVERLVNGFITMHETMEIIKQVNRKLKDFKNWNPPAFEVSKSFINYFDETSNE